MIFSGGMAEKVTNTGYLLAFLPRVAFRVIS